MKQRTLKKWSGRYLSCERRAQVSVRGSHLRWTMHDSWLMLRAESRLAVSMGDKVELAIHRRPRKR